MIFDASTLPHTESLNKLIRPYKPYEHSKLKEWWARLSEEEQAQICTIDTPEIISDVLDTANTALILFKLNPKFKKKSVMSVQRVKDSTGAVASHIYDFNFTGKQMIQDDLAQLFSSYCLFGGVNCFKTKAESQPASENGTAKPYMAVKKEKLTSILDLLENAILNFGQGKKAVFSREHALNFYPLFTKNVFLKMSFSDIESSSIQELFYKLLILTLFLENNLYLSYSQKITSSIFSRLVNTSPVFYSQNFTPAKLEAEHLKAFKSNSPTLSVTSNTETCDSNSKSKSQKKNQQLFSNTETISNEFSELSQPSDKEGGSESIAFIQDQGFSPRSGGENVRIIPEEYIAPTVVQSALSSIANVYDGFYIENLQIDFRPEDEYLEYSSSEDEREEESQSSSNGGNSSEHFREEQGTSYHGGRYYRNVRTFKDVDYQGETKDSQQETTSEPFSNEERWYNKGKKNSRYGKYYKKRDRNEREQNVDGTREDEYGEEYFEDRQGEFENGWGESYREQEYKENKGKWKGKSRHEVVYCLKGENQKEKGVQGEKWKRNSKTYRNEEERVEKSRQERLK